MKVTLQVESQECSLACLVMIAGHHGLHLDLMSLRRHFSISIKGTSLAQLMRYAQNLEFSCRPLRLELDDMSKLRIPCILHWDMNHFVVLDKVSRSRLYLLDPARGRRVLTLSEASRHFTGVALELTPNASFRPAQQRAQIRLLDLVVVV